jgi:hypothetical protein
VFLPYSAFFLNFNVACVAFLVFFDKFSNTKDTLDILTEFFPREGEELDPERDTDLIEEIDSQAADPEWGPTMHDFKDVVTCSRVSSGKFASIIGQGMVQSFKTKPAAFQNMVKAIVLALSLVILVIYSLVMYFTDNSSKMGIVISVSVVCMDLFTFILVFSNLVHSPPSILFLLILNRSLMIGLGTYYWVYGYMVLYVIYALTFVFIIARNNFPFADDIVLRSQQLGTIKVGGLNPKDAAAKEALKAKAANPAVLLLILSVFYILLLLAVTIMEAAEMQGLELKRVSVDAENPERTLGYVVAGFLTVVFVFTFYFFLALFRIMVRKAGQTDLYSRKNAPASAFTCYKKNPYFDILTQYILIS